MVEQAGAQVRGVRVGDLITREARVVSAFVGPVNGGWHADPQGPMWGSP